MIMLKLPKLGLEVRLSTPTIYRTGDKHYNKVTALELFTILGTSTWFPWSLSKFREVGAMWFLFVKRIDYIRLYIWYMSSHNLHWLLARFVASGCVLFAIFAEWCLRLPPWTADCRETTQKMTNLRRIYADGNQVSRSHQQIASCSSASWSSAA